MKITKQELIYMNACWSGMERFKHQTNDTDEPVDVASLVGGVNTLYDLTWFAYRALPHQRVARLMCDCALLSVEWIKPYTNNYDMIEQFLKEPAEVGTSDEVLRAVRRASATADLGAAIACRSVSNTALYIKNIDTYCDFTDSWVIQGLESAVECFGNQEKVHQLLIDMFNEVQ